MDWTISPDLVRIVVPIAAAHSAIGLVIVGVMMWKRSDNTLKLFGVGIGLFAVALGTAAITTGLRPDEGTLRIFTVIGGLATLVAALVLLRVGVEDYSFTWRRIVLVCGVLWAVILLALEFTIDSDAPSTYTEAGFVNANLHAVTTMWLLVGLVFAFFEAAHITVEHSHGEPYRTILLGAMSVMALSIVVTAVASSDSLRFLNAIVGSAATGVMWIAVVVHERREIAREREEKTRQVEGGSAG